MDTSIFLVILGIIWIVQGLSALIRKENDKFYISCCQTYTEESVKKFMPFYGIVLLVVGIVCVVGRFVKIFAAIPLAIAIGVLIVGLLVGFFAILKKK